MVGLTDYYYYYLLIYLFIYLFTNEFTKWNWFLPSLWDFPPPFVPYIQFQTLGGLKNGPVNWLIALNISNGLMCPIMGKNSIYYTLLDSRNVQQNTCTRDETIYGKSGRHTSVICTSFGGIFQYEFNGDVWLVSGVTIYGNTSKHTSVIHNPEPFFNINLMVMSDWCSEWPYMARLANTQVLYIIRSCFLIWIQWWCWIGVWSDHIWKDRQTHKCYTSFGGIFQCEFNWCLEWPYMARAANTQVLFTIWSHCSTWISRSCWILSSMLVLKRPSHMIFCGDTAPTGASCWQMRKFIWWHRSL